MWSVNKAYFEQLTVNLSVIANFRGAVINIFKNYLLHYFSFVIISVWQGISTIPRNFISLELEVGSYYMPGL